MNSPGHCPSRVRTQTVWLYFHNFHNEIAMEANSNNIFEHKTRARATFFGTCARAIVSCLRNARARGLSRALGKRQYIVIFACASTCFYNCFRFSPTIKLLTEHGTWWSKLSPKLTSLGSVFRQIRKPKMCFDCTGGTDCMSPRRGTPKVA